MTKVRREEAVVVLVVQEEIRLEMCREPVATRRLKVPLKEILWQVVAARAAMLEVAIIKMVTVQNTVAVVGQVREPLQPITVVPVCMLVAAEDAANLTQAGP